MLVESQDLNYMQKALALAQEVLYLTDPNPRVGCVIVKDNKIIGEGATQQVGGPHAEVMAINDAIAKGYESLLKGSTFYVTLEPCSHYGRTPPCADRLVAYKPERVVVATLDPNPLVAGRGIRKLQEAGIEVSYPLLADEAIEINRGFISRMKHQRPWVWTKLASSMDGKIALNNGVSQWITSEAARVDGQHWRARSSVVLTGSGTILHDNPRLNVRAFQTERQPIRAVIDGQFIIPEGAALFDGNPVWIFTYTDNPAKVERLSAKNVEIIKVPQKQHKIDLKAVWQVFVEREINEVHVEAGQGLNTALLAAGLVDEILWYVAPKLLGPGQEMFTLPTLTSLEGEHPFEWVSHHLIGSDLRLCLRHQQRWQQLKES